ncbi:hypothetical protein ACFL0M_00895 [Thermodesulfobacteriota bacterium]
MDINIRGILSNYIQYLSSVDGYNTSSDAPLFPKYEGKNGDKTLYRDLEKPLKKVTFDNITEISNIGARNYYRSLLDRGHSQNESLKKTAEQFRKTENTIYQKVKNILPRKKLTSFEKVLIHWDEMLLVDFSNQSDVKKYELRGLKFIKGMKCKDDIKQSINKTFLEAIKTQKKVFSASTSQPQISKKKHVDFMRDLIELFKAAKIDYGPSSKIFEKYYFGED